MVKKKEEKLPVNVDDMIKKQLQAQKGQLGSLPSNKIGLKNKEFTLPNGQKSSGPLECIILDFVWFMVHYPGVYNSNNPQQPNCFAVGRENPENGALAPHEDVKTPQGENCQTCPMNEWGSAPTGRGKACKNQRRLIIVPPDFDEDTDPMSIYVSPGGLKYFDKYVSRLNGEQGVLPVQVITDISFDVDQTYPLLQFAFNKRHTRVNDAWAMRERSQDLLFRTVETKEADAA